MTEDEAADADRRSASRDSTLTDDDKPPMTREAGGSPFVLEQLAALRRHQRSEDDPSRTRSRQCSTRGSRRSRRARRSAFLETLAICGRPMAPEIVCDACGVARDRQSLVVMLRASRLIPQQRLVGPGRDLSRSDSRGARRAALRPTPCGRFTAAWWRRSSRDGATTVKRCSNTIAAPAIPSRASAQAGLAARKPARRSPSIAPRPSTATRWTLAPASAGWQHVARRTRDRARQRRPPRRGRRGAICAPQTGRTSPAAWSCSGERRSSSSRADTSIGASTLIRSVLESVGLSRARQPTHRRDPVDLATRAAPMARADVRDATRTTTSMPMCSSRLDTCWSAATGLALVDMISASDFIAQHLHMALDAGEPSRIARGWRSSRRPDSADWPFREERGDWRERSQSPGCMSVGTPQAIAHGTRLADSMTASAVGEWKRALTSSEQALTILRDQCVGVTWEMNIAQNIVIWALMYLGELGEVSRRVPALLADARRSGQPVSRDRAVHPEQLRVARRGRP